MRRQPALMLQAFGSADNLVSRPGAGIYILSNVVRLSDPSISRRSNWRLSDEPAKRPYCRAYTEMKVPVFSVSVLPLTVPV